MLPFAATAEDIDLAKRRRRAHVRQREEWQALQKAAVNRDEARHYSAMAKEALRSERAASLVVAILEGGPGPMPKPAAEIEPAFRHEWQCVECGFEPLEAVQN